MLYQSFESLIKEREFLEDINDGSVDAAVVLSTNEEMQQLGTVPIQYMQIFKNQSQDDLLERCRINFENLLQRIK